MGKFSAEGVEQLRQTTTWRGALDTLSADAPARFLSAPATVAAASSRIENLTINPYSWLSELRVWCIRRP